MLNLMMARGGFDPKIEVDFSKKQFKDTEYYSIPNSSFKIPTWYGIEIKAGFDNNEGVYLNPGKYGSKPRSYLTWSRQFHGTRVGSSTSVWPMYAKQNANAIEPSRTKTSSNCRFV
jgi:hypothetical protein